jgi:predicted MPP superfamily phosphohydrolase
MTRILHLSDLHLLADKARQQILFRSLLSALRQEVSTSGRFNLMVITGDVFASALVDRDEAVRAFSWLHRQVVEAIARNAAHGGAARQP